MIARTGDTGQTEQPQLHFEIRQGTDPVNPTALLIESRANQASLVPSDPANS